jgi:hypothetical protein
VGTRAPGVPVGSGYAHSMTPQGGRPCPQRATARGVKLTGEADRVPPASHKSAEPVKVGRLGTSAPSGPASVSVTERVTEPMSEASVEHALHQIGSGWSGRKAGGAPIRAESPRIRVARTIARQALAQLVVANARNPHGVESAPKTDKGSSNEPGNLATTSPALKLEMIETTDERCRKGRSLRSSPRAGKPPTWRRETVGTASRQEVGR